MKRVIGLVVAGLCGVAVGAVGVAPAEAAGPWSVVAFQTPLDKPAAAVTYVGSGACGAPGQCVLPGYYSKASRVQESFVTTVSDGVQSSTALPPADPAYPDQIVTSSACATAGPCVVIGSYSGPTHRPIALLATQTASGWQVIPAPRPAGRGVSQVELDDVACGAAVCYAVGSFGGTSQKGKLLVERYANGQWTLTTFSGPAGLTGYPSLRTVACVSDDRCVAIGGIQTSTGTQTIGAVWDGTTWTTSVVTLPPDAQNQYALRLISACASDGSCHALAEYPNSGNSWGLADLAYTGGSWHSTALPKRTGTIFVDPYGLHCTAAESCVAVATGNIRNVGNVGVVETLSADGWQLTYAPAPGQPDQYAGVRLTTMACGPGRACTGFGTSPVDSHTIAIATSLTGTPRSNVLPTPGRDPSTPASSSHSVFDGTRQIVYGNYRDASGAVHDVLWIRTV